MRRTARAFRRAVLALLICALSVPLVPYVEAKESPPRKIGPGPRQMSDDEKALAADPNASSNDAVILDDESELDERFVERVSSHHLRAVILSNEGRDLANVEIDLYGHDAILDKWWGFVVLPDGTVHDVPRSELVEQTLVTRRDKRLARAFKAILPGVVPGSVIDYGYVVSRDEDFQLLRRIELQGTRPVRAFTYRWKPLSIPANCYLQRTEGFKVTSGREAGRTFVIEAEDLPSFIDEPMAPPDDEIRPGASCYYTTIPSPGGEFWNDFATFTDERAARFVKRSSFVKKAMKEISFPPDADVVTRLRTAYDWMSEKFHTVELLSAEEATTHRRRRSRPRARRPMP